MSGKKRKEEKEHEVNYTVQALYERIKFKLKINNEMHNTHNERKRKK